MHRLARDRSNVVVTPAAAAPHDVVTSPKRFGTSIVRPSAIGNTRQRGDEIGIWPVREGCGIGGQPKRLHTLPVDYVRYLASRRHRAGVGWVAAPWGGGGGGSTMHWLQFTPPPPEIVETVLRCSGIRAALCGVVSVDACEEVDDPSYPPPVIG
jgi:hypothetical protein